MASKWSEPLLGECMAAIIDYRGKSPRKTSAGVPLITAKIVKGGRINSPQEFIDPDDYEEWMVRGIPKTGDVVLTTEAPLGEVAQLDGSKVALAQRIITLRGREGVLDNTFLKFLLQSPSVQDQLEARSTGTTVRGIRQSELRKIRFRLPPIAMQREIGAILGTLDEKIELNRRMNETLEMTARAAYSFLMEHKGMKAAGWKTRKAIEAFDLLGGGTPKTSVAEFWGGDIPWFSVVDTPSPGDVWVLDTVRKITRAGLGSCAADILPVGTTIVTARGTVGQLALVGVPMAMNQSCYAVRGREPLGPFLTYYSLRSLLDILKRRSHGSVFDTITRDTFRGIEVRIPPSGVAAEFESSIRPLFEQMRLNLRQTGVLSATRDVLLPKLISGEVA